MQDLTGKDIERYHIIKKLGQGGMAVVYHAFDTRLERDVSLKFIRVEEFSPSSLERVLKRFEKEGKALGRFSHGNIVQVYDYGEYEGEPYLVMEYLPGGTLKNFTGKPVEWRDAFRLLIPIARGLAYAHAEGVVHRDVKPSNIIIGKTGEPKLADFGIARILEGDTGGTLTGTGVGIGTPEYMAPEQAQGKIPDGRADVYALGVVLYELITGCKPYTADTPMAVVIKQVTDPLPHPGEFVQDIPTEVEQVLFKALAKDPGNRYENMETFAAGMEKLLWQPIESRKGKDVGGEKHKPEDQKSGEDRIFEDPDATRDDIRIDEKKQKKYPVEKQKRTSGLPWWAWTGGFGGLVVLVVLISLFSGGDSGGLDFLSSQTPTLTQISEPTQTPEPTLTLTSIPSQTITPTTVLELGSTRVSEKDGMVQVYVPAGAFEMGASADQGYDIGQEYWGSCERSWFENEEPVHTVILYAYWIDQIEVTNVMYAKCVADGACGVPGGDYYGDSDYADHPVVNVSWYDAVDYCEWAGRELPTEAEWEKAARGTDERIYPWGDEFLCRNGNFDDETVQDSYVIRGGAGCDGYIETSPVGSFPGGASPFGALDMSGNVWEWVSDYYDENYYIKSPVINPENTNSSLLKVLRGGSWFESEPYVRSAKRGWGNPTVADNTIGFRCLTSDR